jgi:hypothetical protein
VPEGLGLSIAQAPSLPLFLQTLELNVLDKYIFNNRESVMADAIVPSRYTYRRLKGDRFWHLSRLCQSWPKENYDEFKTEEEPPGAVCAYCLREHLQKVRAQLKRSYSS